MKATSRATRSGHRSSQSGRTSGSGSSRDAYGQRGAGVRSYLASIGAAALPLAVRTGSSSRGCAFRHPIASTARSETTFRSPFNRYGVAGPSCSHQSRETVGAGGPEVETNAVGHLRYNRTEAQRGSPLQEAGYASEESRRAAPALPCFNVSRRDRSRRDSSREQLLAASNMDQQRPSQTCRSKRSRLVTLAHAATKSVTNFSFASVLA